MFIIQEGNFVTFELYFRKGTYRKGKDRKGADCKVCMDEALRCVHAGGPARSRALATHPGIQPDGLHPSPAAGSVGRAAPAMHRPPQHVHRDGAGRCGCTVVLPCLLPTVY